MLFPGDTGSDDQTGTRLETAIAADVMTAKTRAHTGRQTSDTQGLSGWLQRCRDKGGM
jgi:hypothetical protein